MQVIFHRLVNRVCRLSGAEGATVVSTANPERPVTLVATGVLADLVDPGRPTPDCALGRCLAERRTVPGGDEPDGDGCGCGMYAPGIGSMLHVPLLDLDGVLHGALVLAASSADAFPEAAWPAIEEVAGAIGDVLARRDASGRATDEQQAKVLESERRFRAFMDAVPAVAWIKDGEGRYAFINDRFESLWRIEATETLGKTDLDLFPAEVARQLAKHDDVVRSQRTAARLEERVPSADGNAHTWWSTKFPIPAADGSVHVGGVSMDITDRKLAEAQLRESELTLRRSEASLRALVDNLAEGVLITRDGMILYANAAALPIFGARTSDELVGVNMRDLAAKEERSQLILDMAEVARGRPVLRVRRMRRLDGSRVELESHGSRIDYEGAPATAVLVRDVTERREQEQRLQMTERLASVGTLAAAVAHEINNPLTWVSANLGLLHEELRETAGPAPSARMAEMQAMCEDALSGADRIRRIVRSMRTLARDGSSDAVEAIDLLGPIEAAIQLTTNEIRHRAELVRELGRVPPVLASDTRITQVVVNLLTNAAQAIPLGDPMHHKVRIQTRTSAEGAAVIEVSDDGCGIPADVQKRIFDPFYTTKPVGEGTGLGLSIVHNIVSDLGGQVLIESEVGQGTTFQVVLPPARSDLALAQAHASSQVGQPAPGAPRHRVLLVDDEDSIARVLARVLSPGGYDVTVAASGKQALALLSERRFDAVITDVMMPGMDGGALYAEIERLHPQLAPRVIFITGGAFIPSARAFLERVPNQRLEKPIDPMQLKAALSDLLSAVPTEEEARSPVRLVR